MNAESEVISTGNERKDRPLISCFTKLGPPYQPVFVSLGHHHSLPLHTADIPP